MARKKPVFFRILKSIIQSRYSRRGWIVQPLLAIMIAFLSIIIPPVLAKPAVVNTTAPNLATSQSQTQNLLQQGKKLYEAGQFSLAVKALQQAAVDFRTHGDSLREAMTLSNLCLAFQQLGLWSEAEKAIQKAIASLQTQNLNNHSQHSKILAQALDVRGQLQLSQGQAEVAVTTWQQAAEIYQQIKDSAALTRNRINSAQAMQVLGRYRQANKILTEVSQTLKNEPDSLTKAVALLRLGNIRQVVGDLKESQQLLEQSLALAKATSSNQVVSEALFNLGNTARIQHDTKTAQHYYQQAISASVDPSTRIQAYLNQLSLLVETNQLADALAFSSKIDSEINNLPPSRMAVDAKINFAQSLMKLASKDRADEGVLKAISPSYPSLQTSAQRLATAVQQAQSLQDKRAESYAIGTLGNLYEINQQFSDAQKLTEKALFLAQSIDASDIVYQWQWQLGRIRKQQGDLKGAVPYYREAFQTLRTLRSDLVAINPV